MKHYAQRGSTYLIAAVLAGLLAYGFWPATVSVDVVVARRDTIQVTVNEDGKTRIREKYLVSAPVGGKLFRIELDPGDEVFVGKTVLARIEPGDPALLDARAQAEAEARVRASEASVQQVAASLERAKEAHELAQHNFQRAVQLKEQRTLSTAEFDQFEHRERMASAEVRAAEFSAAVSRFELELAHAALVRTKPASGKNDDPTTLAITSPIDGRVLRVLQENASVVTSSVPLIEIGDPNDLEMEIDVLSTDAVRIRPGAQVLVEQWGGPETLAGQVRLVEPSAFLKISALGVEEQRVNVIADFISPYAERPLLGDMYRLEARIIVDEAHDVVTVPTGVLFREHDSWQAYAIVNGRAEQRQVVPGKGNGTRVEIVAGLAEGESLILHPTDKIFTGVRVRAR